MRSPACGLDHIAERGERLGRQRCRSQNNIGHCRSLCTLGPSEQSHPAETAVPMNIDTHMLYGPDIERLCSKLNDMVRLQELWFQQHGPKKTLAGQIRILHVAKQYAIDGDLMRIVAFEVGRIDLNLLDASGMTQAENDPIGPGFAPPPGFPTVRHARTTAR